MAKDNEALRQAALISIEASESAAQSQKRTAEFNAPVATTEKTLTGQIVFPNGAGVTALRGKATGTMVGFTFMLDEIPEPLTLVLSVADAKQMQQMLDDVIEDAGK